VVSNDVEDDLMFSLIKQSSTKPKTEVAVCISTSDWGRNAASQSSSSNHNSLMCPWCYRFYCVGRVDRPFLYCLFETICLRWRTGCSLLRRHWCASPIPLRRFHFSRLGFRRLQGFASTCHGGALSTKMHEATMWCGCWTCG